MLRNILTVSALATAASQCVPTWYESTKHGNGFRNVSTYGAKGDGIADDTAALMQALTQGRASGPSTKDPVIVYLPPGTYKVSQTLPLFFYTFLTGGTGPGCRATILLAPGTFAGKNGYVIDADVNDEGGDHDNEFYREISHIDLTIGTNNADATGIHWAVSQATSIQDVVINVGSGSKGLFCENGSGGWMADLVITGGTTGMQIGNQQWTMRNISISGSRSICLDLIWDWQFVLMGLNLANCPTGVHFQGNSAGSVIIQDSTFTNIPTGVHTDFPGHIAQVMIENCTFNNVPTISTGFSGSAGTTVVPLWVQGIVYNGTVAIADGNAQRTLMPTRKTKLPGWPRPSFQSLKFENVLDHGAVNDGTTDCTAAFAAAFAASQNVFIPSGWYLLSASITVGANAIIIGEGFAALVASSKSPLWSNKAAPAPLIATPVGSTVNIMNLMFTSDGDVPGCIMLDWQSTPASSTWDVHWRTEHVLYAQMNIHGAATGGTMHNSWAWVADHSIDGGGQLDIDNPRGITVDGISGPFTFLGVAAEHSSGYQLQVSNSNAVTIVMLQTESAYWQNPPTGWALSMVNTSNSAVYGTGSYNWFNGNQSSIISITGCKGKGVSLYGVNVYNADSITVGDINIPKGPSNKQWFTSGYIAQLGM